jgi:hypothetical protein
MNTGPSPQAQAFSLRQRAQWHRKQSEDYLNHSVSAMRQHKQAAEAMEEQADKLEQEPQQ